MNKEIENISMEVEHLKAVTLNQTCNECFVMKNYISNQYHQLHSKFQALEKLGQSNLLKNQPHSTQEIKKSISILGLYVLV